jgi:hypothetical protein
VSVDSPTPPPWIAELPQDGRGFYVPAEAGWQSGEPVFSKYSVERTVALAMRRACAVCGYLMPKGSLVYRAFALDDALHMRQYERERSHDTAGPLHKSCILYSAIVCPYLRTNGRLGKDSTINPGGQRGRRAAVMGFQDMGLMMYAERHPFLNRDYPLPMIAYLELAEDISYREGPELIEHYHAAVEADSQIIDVSEPRLFWTDAKPDIAALGQLLVEDYRSLMHSEPIDTLMVLNGVVPFMVFPR